MLSQKNIAPKQANKDDQGQSTGGGRKTSSLRPPEQILKCPRCDSPNTKFCYYNNYSLAQPRHFCKSCRRYWTNGGALRNVPIGGSCRKNKKTKSSYSSSRFFVGDSSTKPGGSATSDIGGIKFYGLSAALDFQLGGLNQFSSSSYADHTSSSSNPSFVHLDHPLGFNFPLSSSHPNYQSGSGLASFHEMGTSNNNHLHQHTDLASSIESLSSINQDLHWKLQQQRLAMLYSEENDQKKQDVVVVETQGQKLQPILFQNLETSKPAAQSSMDGDSRKDASAGLATEWFFDNMSSYAAPLNLNPPTPTPTNSNSAGNDNQNGSMNNWNGIQAWNHFG